MTAQKILDGKSGALITIRPDACVAEASILLNKHKIGALLIVNDQGDLQGIFTERDIVRALGEKQDEKAATQCLDKPVSEYMVEKVQTCTPSDTIDSIMIIMSEGRFRHVPIMSDQQKLLGMISIGDVVKYRIKTLEQETAAMRDYIMHS
ncbi:MAG: CBS domain-containing protein [Alphaproteobacteria bacterium]